MHRPVILSYNRPRQRINTIIEASEPNITSIPRDAATGPPSSVGASHRNEPAKEELQALILPPMPGNHS